MSHHEHPMSIPLSFDAAVSGLLAVDGKAIPKPTMALTAKKAAAAKKKAVKKAAKKKTGK